MGYFDKFCQNLRSFQRELVKLLEYETISIFWKTQYIYIYIYIKRERDREREKERENDKLGNLRRRIWCKRKSPF